MKAKGCLAVLVTAAALAAPCAGAGPPAGGNSVRIDFPCFRGRDGSGASPASGKALIDDIAEAKLLWESDERIPGAWQGFPKGGYAQPVLAGGRLYLYYPEPTGDLLAGNVLTDKWASKAPRDQLEQTAKIEADDVVLCLDAATGGTIWRRAFAGGLNPYNLRKRGPHNPVAVFDGKAFAQGGTGRCFCLDAESGELLWRYDDFPLAGDWAATLAECKQKMQQVPYRGAGIRWPGLPFTTACVYGEGVVAFGDGQRALWGFDAATGKRLWGAAKVLTGYASPARWVHRGEVRFIGPEGSCLDPKTGRVLWKAEGAYNGAAPAVSESYMVTQGSEKHGGPACYRISPEGGEKLWTLDKKYSAQWQVPVIHGGHVYITSQTRGQKPDVMLCVELDGGKIVGRVNIRGSTEGLVLADGRILRLRESLAAWINADPTDFRLLGAEHRFPSHAGCTTPLLADGRLYFRGVDRVLCYDVRAAQ